jgi:hypothetical protein
VFLAKRCSGEQIKEFGIGRTCCMHGTELCTGFLRENLKKTYEMPGRPKSGWKIMLKEMLKK